MLLTKLPIKKITRIIRYIEINEILIWVAEASKIVAATYAVKPVIKMLKK